MLWDVCGEDILGKATRRQGGSKQKSEIEDICNAFEKLSERQVLPVFIATSNMILRTPSFQDKSSTSNFHSIEKKLDEVQESLDEFRAKQSDLANKNHDRIISKAEVGHKKIDELVKKLEILHAKHPVTTEPLQQSHSLRLCDFAARTQSKNDLVADTSLVVKGIALHVKENQLQHLLSEQGIETFDWKTLTTYENARSLTFKFTVKASDCEKSKDPNIWPPGVTVDLYRERRQSTKGNDVAARKRSTRLKESKSVRFSDQDQWLRPTTS